MGSCKISYCDILEREKQVYLKVFDFTLFDNFEKADREKLQNSPYLFSLIIMLIHNWKIVRFTLVSK